MFKGKPLFGGIKPSGNGTVTIPKSAITKSKDPEALRHDISEQYTEAVQRYPELEFGIFVDAESDDIRITWSERK